MKLGLMMFSTDTAIAPDHLAREAEARGFESFFVPEHTNIPVSRRTPYPGGEPIPEEYKRTYDPFVALMAAAAATDRLIVGTAICLVAQHHHVNLAKQVASVDVLSRGRFVFGVGYGWNVDELEQHGVAFSERRELVRERILAMKALWTEDEASFEGDLVHLAPTWAWPKPLQKPHPPIFVGGAAGPKLFRHIVELADGWMPIGGAGLKENLAELRRTAEEAGRDPDTIQVMLTGVNPDPGKLEYYESLGVLRVLCALPSADADTVLRIVDRYAALV
jgi:probable F420-dependent oxidoreductase